MCEVSISSNFALPKNSNLLSHPDMNLSPDSRPSIGCQFIELESVDSTNNYAMAQIHAGLALHGTVYMALEQFEGKGQRGKSWTSPKGENITLSIVLQPVFLQPSKQFSLSVALAVGCHDFLQQYVKDDLYIKWPNDLYWRDRKTGGILTESICRGAEWIWAVAGIGININQTSFPLSLPNPVSLKQIAGKEFSVIELAKQLCGYIEKRWLQLEKEGSKALLKDYNNFLYKKNELISLKKGQLVFETKVEGVNAEGQLITTDALQRGHDFAEVEWIIPA
jgi:BirA family transcriptional regulator, biotin operon repressor / biotin---[acetyl-CoA-carboxylase] ligase